MLLNVSGQTLEAEPGQTFGEVLAKTVSKKRMKDVVAARCGDRVLDLSKPVDPACAAAEPVFTDTIELDLSTVEPSLAGPKRPQDRVALKSMKGSFRKSLVAPVKDRGFGLGPDDLTRTASVEMKGITSTLAHGAVTIAAITSTRRRRRIPKLGCDAAR